MEARYPRNRLANPTAGYPLQVAEERMPTRIDPMKARLGEPDPATAWEFEVKWDGYRAIAFCGERLRIQGRRMNEITGDFPELASLGTDGSTQGLVLDGELVVFGKDGVPDFQLMQARRDLGLEATFIVFDLLWAHGADLRSAPYVQRRERLESLALAGETWTVPERLDGKLADVLAATSSMGLEGVVAKDPGSPYVSGKRSRYWIKVKHTLRQEFVVGGWLPGKGLRASTLGALLLGYHDDTGDELRFAGRVGTGMDDRMLKHLTDQLVESRRELSPFREADRSAIPRTAFWTDPGMVVEVSFTQWTRDGVVRNPVFLGLRPDKAAGEVLRERP